MEIVYDLRMYDLIEVLSSQIVDILEYTSNIPINTLMLYFIRECFHEKFFSHGGTYRKRRTVMVDKDG